MEASKASSGVDGYSRFMSSSWVSLFFEYQARLRSLSSMPSQLSSLSKYFRRSSPMTTPSGSSSYAGSRHHG